MSLTLQNAITEVRDILNEASPVFWSDDQITKWIQEGCRNFSTKTLLYETTETLTTAQLTDGQMVYTSSDEAWIGDLLEVYAAIYYDGTSAYKGLVKVHPRKIGNLATSTAGHPKYYTQFGRSLYIWPVPSAAVAAAGEISFLVSKETDDITVLSDEYQHIPITYAKAMALHRDKMYSQAQAHLMQFKEEVQMERADKHNREVDTLMSFKVPTGGQTNA